MPSRIFHTHIHTPSPHTCRTVWFVGPLRILAHTDSVGHWPWHCYCRTLQCLSVQVLAKIEGMGMKSRFVELRENRQREERERREKLVSCALLG